MNVCINAVEMEFAKSVPRHRTTLSPDNSKVLSKAVTVGMTRVEAEENPTQMDLSNPMPLRKRNSDAGSESTPFYGSPGPTMNTLLMSPSWSNQGPYAAPIGSAVPGLLTSGVNSCNRIFVYPNLGFPGPDFSLRTDYAMYTIQHPFEAFRLFPERKWEPSESFEIKEASSYPSNFQQRLAERFYYGPPVQSIIRHRRKLLILDINGLLADIVCPPPKDHKADVNIASRAVFKRPFYLDFLKFCFAHFDVGIWSSRTRKNVQKVVDHLLGDLKDRLLFCCDLSHCTISKFKTLENKHKPIVFKDVWRLWEKYDPDLPWEKGYYDQSNTLLLDDSPYKALLNPPNTGVFPHSYCFKHEGDASLGAGGDLRHYLEQLIAANDIRQFVEQHPYGQRAIAEDSASWGFYSNVVSTVRPYAAYRSAQTWIMPPLIARRQGILGSVPDCCPTSWAWRGNENCQIAFLTLMYDACAVPYINGYPSKKGDNNLPRRSYCGMQALP